LYFAQVPTLQRTGRPTAERKAPMEGIGPQRIARPLTNSHFNSGRNWIRIYCGDLTVRWLGTWMMRASQRWPGGSSTGFSWAILASDYDRVAKVGSIYEVDTAKVANQKTIDSQLTLQRIFLVRHHPLDASEIIPELPQPTGRTIPTSRSSVIAWATSASLALGSAVADCRWCSACGSETVRA